MDGSNLSLPANETIKKDCLAVGYIYKSHRFDLDNRSTQSTNLAEYILDKYLIEINAFYNNRTYVFFPFLPYEKTYTYNNNKKIIESDTITILDVDDSDSYTKYYDSLISNLSSEISTNYETIQISIILSEHCYEQTLADIIIDTMQGHFTYIAVNAFCVQIFCKKQNLNNILEFIRSILPSSYHETLIKYIHN